MNKTLSVEREVLNKIMATDIYIKLVSDHKSEFEMQIDLNRCFEMLENFEKKYSRFINDNELSKFNNSEQGELATEFLEILLIAIKYFEKSEGTFDIGVLPILQKEGYVFSKNKGFTGTIQPSDFVSISTLKLDGNKYIKPMDLHIDLGGIGKGFVNDKVCTYLRREGYKNFVVDTGGDIRFEGVNVEDNLDYWVAGVTDPYTNENFALLKLNNKSVATSGVNKRKWKINGIEKNHLIDISKKQSVENSHYTSTVIADSTTEADISAKILIMKSYTEAELYGKINNLPFIFVEKDRKIIYSNLIQEYLYED